jgi:hypothetical protein
MEPPDHEDLEPLPTSLQAANFVIASYNRALHSPALHRIFFPFAFFIMSPTQGHYVSFKGGNNLHGVCLVSLVDHRI